MKVNRDVNCIFWTTVGQDRFKKSHIEIKPKHGQAGINDQRILYLPKKDYIGMDKMVIIVGYIGKQSGVYGTTKLIYHFTIE